MNTLNVTDYVYQALLSGLVSYVDLDKLSFEDILNVIEIDQVKRRNAKTIRELMKDEQ